MKDKIGRYDIVGTPDDTGIKPAQATETSSETIVTEATVEEVTQKGVWPPKISGIEGAKKDSRGKLVMQTKTNQASPDRILQLIKNGKWKETIERLRAEPDELKQAEIKKELDAFLWSGTFSYRSKENLIRYSGIICIDLDELDKYGTNPDKAKQDLKGCKHIISAYDSPRNNGLKVLVDGQDYNSKTHKIGWAKASKIVEDLTGAKSDIATKDFSRLAYASYDPDITWTWDTTSIPAPTEEELEGVKKQMKDFGEIKFTDKTDEGGRRVLEMEVAEILSYKDQNGRNHAILTSSASIGNLVAGGHIALEDAELALEAAAVKIGDNESLDRRTVQNGLRMGMKTPRKLRERVDESEYEDAAMEVWGPEETPTSIVSPNGKDCPAEKKQKKTKIDIFACTDTGDDLNKAPPVEHEWIIDKWLPVGLTKLVANEKAGKTWIGMQMALAITQGKPYLDTFDTKQGDVLYLGLEQSRELNHGRFSGLQNINTPKGAPLVNIPGNLRIWSSGKHQFPLLNEGGLDLMIDWINGTKNPVAIIIDVYQSIASGSNGKDNAYVADSKALRPLQALANEKSIGILILHHTRKGSSGSSHPSETTNGSKAMDSIPEHNLFLQREYGSNDAIIKITSRVCKESAEMALRFVPEQGWDKEKCFWEYAGTGKDYTLTIKRQQIIKVLEMATTRTEALTVGEVLSELKNEGVFQTYNGVRMMLNRMAEENRIQRVASLSRKDGYKYYGVVSCPDETIPDPNLTEVVSDPKAEAEAIPWDLSDFS